MYLTSDGKLEKMWWGFYGHYRDIFERGVLEECTPEGITYSLDGKREHIDLMR